MQEFAVDVIYVLRSICKKNICLLPETEKKAKVFKNVYTEVSLLRT